MHEFKFFFIFFLFRILNKMFPLLGIAARLEIICMRYIIYMRNYMYVYVAEFFEFDILS